MATYMGTHSIPGSGSLWTNNISLEKLMNSFEIPKEYYKEKYGISVGQWLRLYKDSLKVDKPENNDLPDELFEI